MRPRVVPALSCLLAWTAFLGGCASPSILVRSAPDGAEVHLVRPGGQLIPLGKTPLSVTRRDAPELFSETVQLQVRKEGFYAESLLLPKASFGSDASAHFALNEVPKPKAPESREPASEETGDEEDGEISPSFEEIAAKVQASTIRKQACAEKDEALDDLARQVATVQSMIFARRYTEGEQQILALSAKFPSMSLLYDLLGNVYYLQKDFTRAYGAYRRSVEIEPRNAETRRMVEKIAQLIPAGRVPAAAPTGGGSR